MPLFNVILQSLQQNQERYLKLNTSRSLAYTVHEDAQIANLTLHGWGRHSEPEFLFCE